MSIEAVLAAPNGGSGAPAPGLAVTIRHILTSLAAEGEIPRAAEIVVPPGLLGSPGLW
jgi:hypothetical protein